MAPLRLLGAVERTGDRPAIDGLTLVHAAFGIAIGLLGAPAGIAVAGAAIYRIYESQAAPKRKNCDEQSVAASLDVVATIAGWAGGRAMRPRKERA